MKSAQVFWCFIHNEFTPLKFSAFALVVWWSRIWSLVCCSRGKRTCQRMALNSHLAAVVLGNERETVIESCAPLITNAKPLGAKKENIKTNGNVKSPHYEFCLQTRLIIQRRHFRRFHLSCAWIMKLPSKLSERNFHKFASNTNDMFSGLFTRLHQNMTENYTDLLRLSVCIPFTCNHWNFFIIWIMKMKKDRNCISFQLVSILGKRKKPRIWTKYKFLKAGDSDWK